MVGLGDDRGLVREPLSALGLPHLPGLVVAGGLGRDDGGDAPVAVDDESGRAHGVGLVEVGGQPLAGAAGVDEDECGAVGEHLVEDRVLDVRPDRGGHLAAPAAAHWTGGAGGPSLPRHRLPQGAVGTPGLRMIAPPGTAHRARAPRTVRGSRRPPRRRSAPGPLHAGAPVGDGGHTGHVGHGHGHAHRRRRAPLVGDDRDGPGAAEEPGDLLARGDGRGQADALSGTLQEVVQALQGEGQVGAALLAGEGVDLIDDDGLHGAQRLAHRTGEHEVERFGGGDEDVGRASAQATTLGGRGVARAHAHAHRGDRLLLSGRSFGNAGQGPSQVALDVDSQGLERGDVEDAHAVRGRPLSPRARPAVVRGLGRMLCPLCRIVAGPCALGGGGLDEPVDGRQEGRQRLARPGGRDDERVLAAADRGPGALLDRRRAIREGGDEPGSGRGGEALQRGPGRSWPYQRRRSSLPSRPHRPSRLTLPRQPCRPCRPRRSSRLTLPARLDQLRQRGRPRRPTRPCRSSLPSRLGRSSLPSGLLASGRPHAHVVTRLPDLLFPSSCARLAPGFRTATLFSLSQPPLPAALRGRRRDGIRKTEPRQ